MTYEKTSRACGVSHSNDSTIRARADAWLISNGLQEAAELKLFDLAVRNVKGEITRDKVGQLSNARYADMPKTATRSSHGLDSGYEIVLPDSPRIKKIEEYNRKLRPAMDAGLDK